MAHRARHEDDVALAGPEDLIGDVDAAAVDVAGHRSGDVVAGSGDALDSPVFELTVLTQDAAFELAQLRSRLDPELADQDGAHLSVGRQRIGLAAAAVERQQSLSPEPLTQRVFRSQFLKLGDRLLMAPARQ